MNFKRVISKSSLKSSSSGSLTRAEEVSKLKTDLESLKQAVKALKVSVESRDVAIGTLAREKEKLYVDLKSAQRTNRSLLQQLVDEREIHSKEKLYLTEEIQRLSKREEYEENSLRFPDDERFIESMQDELLAKDKIIYEVCEKYMKLKTNKSCLLRKYRQLQIETQETYENIVLLLQENKIKMDKLFQNLLKFSTVSRRDKKYLKLLQKNVKLNYENTQLKLGISQNNCLGGRDHSIQKVKDQHKHYYPSQNDDAISKEGFPRNFKRKPPKYKVKMRPPKLKLGKYHSPGYIHNFYEEHKSLSILLKKTIKKSNSLPSLHFN